MDKQEAQGGVAGGAALSLAVYCALTAVYFSPLLGGLDRVLLNFPSDPSSTDYGQFLWNFWWTKKSLADLWTNPYYTDWIFYPFEANLSFSTMSFYNCLLSLPLQYFLSPVEIYNLLLMSTFVVTGMAGFYLGRHITGDVRAGFICGLAISFCHFHLHRYQHINIMTYYWIAFYVLSLYRIKDRAKYRDSALMALSLTFACLSKWNQLNYMLLFSILFAAYYHREVFTRRFMAKAGLGAAVFLALVAPAAYPLVKSLIAGTASYDVVPSHVIREQLFGRLINGRLYVWPLLYGWTATCLSIAAVVFARRGGPARDTYFWLVVTVFFFILTLGPNLVVGDRMYPSVTLPMAWMSSIPVLNAVRFSERYMVMVQLSVGVMASIGAAYLLRHSRTRLLYLAAAALMVLEIMPGMHTRYSEMKVSPFYGRMASDSEDYAVVESPLLYFDGVKMAYQGIHGHRMVNGYLSHMQDVPAGTRKLIYENPLLWALYRPLEDKSPTPDAIRRAASELNAGHGIRYLIINKELQYEMRSYWNSEPGEPTALALSPLALADAVKGPWEMDSAARGSMAPRQDILSALGEPYYEDELLKVYRLDLAVGGPTEES